MIKKTFEKVNENLYCEKLNNGIDVYLYNTNKTKNFYISITVKYGANVLKYKSQNKTYTITPGSAHFLEHKVMALSENQEISNRINNLGSLANAWTNYEGTNYNIFGSINLIENLKLLLDIFYNTNINEKNVNEEKGIIGEEIDMYKDQINTFMYRSLLSNLFHNSYVRNTIVGEREDIEKIDAKELNRIYNDFYTSNNTFIIVCGHFDNDEVMNVIKEYIDKLNLSKKKIPKRIKEIEKETVRIKYEEIKKDSEDIRVKYAFKIKKSNFKIKRDVILKYYLSLILSSNFSPSSNLFEKYKNENIVINMYSGVYIIDDYVVIIISSICKDANRFIEAIQNDIKKIKISKETFERKKRLFLKSYILNFDNIEDIEYNICESILLDGKINYNEYSDIINMNYKTAKSILNGLNFENSSIIRTIK